jgi:hypothetical protein
MHLDDNTLKALRDDYQRSLTPEQREAERAEDDRLHYENVDRTRKDITQGFKGATVELQAALSALTELDGDSYDPEYEGQAGDDIRHHIQDGLRSIRAAEAIHRDITQD